MAPHFFQVLYTPTKQALDKELQDGGLELERDSGH